MNLEKLSPRDRQRLAAYLDGELSPRARARVARRVARDPVWRQALEEMQALKAALQALPRPKAPRNFTLTEAQAQAVAKRADRRRGAQRALAYRWASAVAVVLLMFVMVGSWMTAHLATGAAVPKHYAELRPARASAEVEALSPVEPEADQLAEAGQPTPEPSQEAAEAPQIFSAAAPPVTPTPLPAGATGTAEKAAPSPPTSQPTSTACSTPRYAAAAPETNALQPALPEDQRLWRWPWGLLEGLLALAAVGFAVAGFWLARRP